MVYMCEISRKLDKIDILTLATFLAGLYSLDAINCAYDNDDRADLAQMALNVIQDSHGTWTPEEVDELIQLINAYTRCTSTSTP